MSNALCSEAGIFAIIVTYNPILRNVFHLISVLSNQVEKIILIDNASVNFSELYEIFEKNKNIEIISLVKNMGIAHAQNCGIDFAQRSQAKYLVFFDQDSVIEENFVGLLSSYFFSLSKNKKIALVAPVFKDEKKGFFYPLIRLNQYGVRRRIIPDNGDQSPIQVSFVISSGTFTSMAVINEIGGMRNDFFIDYVDIEWCLRAAHAGYLLFAIPAACMLHSIGDRSVVFLKWRLAIHSEWRRYYRIRNGFFLLGIPHIPKILALREIFVNILYQFILIATQKNKKIQLKYLLRAIFNGIRLKL